MCPNPDSKTFIIIIIIIIIYSPPLILNVMSV
jgi:hypothetical protein